MLEAAYMAASAGGTLPAKARQIYYQARPKIMALTDDKELQFGYFSQTLLPDYIEEHGVDWDVVYDARGHFEEPHTNRRIGCGTIEVRNYLHAVKEPDILPADFADASVDVIGPSGNLSAVLFCEKEGFGPLFKAVNLADRYDLMIVSSKGVSVTAARRLIDTVCGDSGLPLFVLHDFDVAGFLILGTLQRDTRRYQFSNAVEVVDLGLRLADIEGLEREPAAATKISAGILRDQLAENGATTAEIDILLNERVELNALTSDALIAMIETQAQGLRAQEGGPGRRPAGGDLSRLPPQSAAAGEVRGDGGGVRRRGRRNRGSERLEETGSRDPRRARRSALGRRHPDRARRNDARSRAGGEAEGQKEIRRLHRRRRRRRRRGLRLGPPAVAAGRDSPPPAPPADRI